MFREVEALYEAVRRDDPSGSIEQFRSLVGAFQYRRLYELTARHVPAGSAVLDWGCGRGHFSYFLLKRGFRVTAFSLEHPPEIFSALKPKELAALTFVRGGDEGAQRLPFADRHFAAVFSVGVLEHVREMGGRELVSLTEIRRVLSPGGAFLCYHLPNRFSYIEALSRLLRRRRRGGEDGFHQYRFTRAAIRRLCAAAGLSIAELGRYGFVPRNSFGRLPPRLGDSRALAAVVNAGDAVLSRLLSPIDQNYYFVAKAQRVRGAGDSKRVAWSSAVNGDEEAAARDRA